MSEHHAVEPDAVTGPAGSSHGDDDTPPTGPRRVLITLYAVFALAATARGVVQIATKFADAPLAYLLSLGSGIVYIAAAVGLVTNRRWSRPLAWAAVGTEMVGVLTVGVASIVDSSAFPHDTVWSRFGAGYGYVPIILPVLGLMWLWQTRGHAERPSEKPASPAG
ncbi:MAG TPA: hypothetical protein VII33_18670 [Nakamurella sp.]